MNRFALQLYDTRLDAICICLINQFLLVIGQLKVADLKEFITREHHFASKYIQHAQHKRYNYAHGWQALTDEG